MRSVDVRAFAGHYANVDAYIIEKWHGWTVTGCIARTHQPDFLEGAGGMTFRADVSSLNK